MEQQLAQAKAAIDALSRPDETIKANEWLVQFELTSDAWLIANSLLSDNSPSQPYRFFGARMLYSKVQRDFKQLQSSNELKDVLISHVSRLALETPNAMSNMTVIRFVCLALSALALQINQAGVVNQILMWLNPIISSAPLVLLELLTNLPEECFNRHVDIDYSIRQSFSEQLSESSSQVFIFLESLSQSSDLKITKQILKCVEHWINYTNIPSQSLLNNNIFSLCLRACYNVELVEDAVETVIATSRKYECKDIALSNHIITNIVGISSLWQSQLQILTPNSDTDECNICRAITRLFTEVCESYMDALLSDTNNLQQHFLFKQLLECTKFPYSNEIARIPLKFFYDVSLILSHSEDNSVLLQKYSEMYSDLIYISIQQMLLTRKVLEGTEEFSEEGKNDRLDWKETIGDCREVLGTQYCLQIICNFIEIEIKSTNPKWNVVESCLSAVQVIGPFLPPDESVFMPQLLDFLTKIPDICMLKLTSIELIGRFSRWISCNPNHLNLILNNLTSNLQSNTTSGHASIAIMNILKSCLGVVGLPIVELHALLMHLRDANSIPLTSDLNLLEGICSIASSYDENICISMFTMIVTPLGQRLNAKLSTITGASLSVHHCLADVDRLTTVMRYTKINFKSTTLPHPVTTAFAQLQPLMNTLLGLVTTEHACEKISRFYKYSIRSASEHFVSQLPYLATHLIQQFQLKLYCCFLYTSSILVSEFGSTNNENSNENTILYTMLWNFSDIFFKTFNSFVEFEKNPDVIEEYFHLLAKYSDICPISLVKSPQLSVLIDAGITGLQLQQKQATKGILHFLEKLINVSTKQFSDNSINKIVENVISQYGNHIVRILMNSLVGAMPVYALRESSGSLCDVLWKLKLFFPKYLHEWLTQFFSQLPVEFQEEAGKVGFPNELLNCAKQRQMTDLLDEFSIRCRKRARVHNG